ncbi:MAG: NAD(P)H-binding protein, partial [Anaerolineales bacterium]|nr:NAD(P)H-binding protein [Anaerolineales bacterium]
MILVTGAAGKTGQAVIRSLLDQGQAVRGFVRKTAQGERLKQLGADEVIVGDLLSLRDVSRAAQGTRAVYHICP